MEGPGTSLYCFSQLHVDLHFLKMLSRQTHTAPVSVPSSAPLLPSRLELVQQAALHCPAREPGRLQPPRCRQGQRPLTHCHCRLFSASPLSNIPSRRSSRTHRPLGLQLALTMSSRSEAGGKGPHRPRGLRRQAQCCGPQSRGRAVSAEPQLRAFSVHSSLEKSGRHPNIGFGNTRAGGAQLP